MTIEDPPWKKRTRPCPFYSQGRCLFADSCNFMHSVTIRRPDSIVGSEDSDQPDFRIVVDSPTAGRAVRFKSPTRSPRTMSLLMALGDVIQKDEEEGEWEEEESGEQESCSGEGSLEGPNGDHGEPPAAYAHVEGDESETSILFSSGGLDTPARPTPILGLSEDARRLLTEVRSPENDSLQYLESSPVGETTTLVDVFSPGTARSPGGETSIMTDDETTVRLRRAIIPEFPLPPTRIPSPRRDSSSSGLLSPIEITAAPPISFPRHAAIAREESFDSGYADGPSPLCRSPPRSPRRMSTLSILSSPFGSPSARVHRFDASMAPAAALFSPRFGTFPPIPEQEHQADGLNARHSRGDSIDSLDLSQEVAFSSEAEPVEQPATDVFGPAREPSPTSTRHSSIPEGSSLFRAVHSPVYPPVDEAALRPGEPAFGEDDTMTSLYDQYYTPTSHSFHLQPTAQEASPATLIGSEPRAPAPMPEAGPSSPRPSSLRASSPRTSSPRTSSPRASSHRSSLPRALSPRTSSPNISLHRASPPHTSSPHMSPSRESSPLPLSSTSSPSRPLSALISPPYASSPRASSFRASYPHASSSRASSPRALSLSASSPRVSPRAPSPQAPSLQASLPGALPFPVPSAQDASPVSSFGVSSPRAPSSRAPSPGVPSLGASSPRVESATAPSPCGSPSQAPSPRAPSRPPSSQAPSIQALSRHASPHPMEYPRVFSPLSSASPAIGQASFAQTHSPAISVTAENILLPEPSEEDLTVHPPAEGSVRSASSMSSRTEDSQGRQVSKKVPFGFRHSVSDRSQTSARSSLIIQSRRVSRMRPPPLLDLGREFTKSEPSTSAIPYSAVEPPSATSSTGPGRLKPLRLSMILSSSSSLNSAAPSSGHPPSLTTATTATTTNTPSSPTVSSEYSLSNNRLLSSPRSSIIPQGIRNTHRSSSQFDSPLHITPVFSDSQPASAPISRPPSWQQRFSKRRSLLVQPSHRLSYVSEQHARSESRLSEPIDESHEDEYDQYEAADQVDETIRRPVSSLSNSRPRPESALLTPVHAIATPRPTLLFALASDDVEEVRRVLESGEARPNDDIGPQSALAFTLASNQLKNKMAMVKLLLAYGADASALREPEAEEGQERSSKSGSRPVSKLLEDADPATRYYIERANSPQTRRASALIHRSFFRPLTRVRYNLIGQDRVLEQLFRVLSMPSMAPIVVLLCGPSGHGKSLLARKFGSLLEVPTHTVNMTTLQNTRDIWKSHSIDPHEEPSDRSLKDFLMENEAKRCVVVLDEIEKTQDEKILSSLLMPWEYGRCSFEAGHRHVDVSKVIWLGTSNIGHGLVFEHQDSRPAPETQLSREEYIDLMGLFRPRVSERLGASLLSRVTAVLPFVAFTSDEKLAIAAEALYALAGEAVTTMPPATRDLIVRTSLNSYIPSEGARSLYRAVSTQLLDTI